MDSEVRRFLEEGGWEEESGVGIFVRVLVEGRGFLVACSDRSLAVRKVGVKGCSEGHSSVERPVREIPRWTVPRTRQRSGSPVECSLPYIACWSRWFDEICGGVHTIPLVGELGCGNLLDGRYFQSKSTVGGQFGS